MSASPDRAAEPLDLLEADPELLALPAPKRVDRALALGLMACATVATGLLAWSLRGEVGYALSSPEGLAASIAGSPTAPLELGELTALAPTDASDNRYVRASGMLGTGGAIRYGRFAEGDSFRLAPVAGNERIWVEIRVPEGFEGPRYVPPTTFAGRLVRFDAAGLRHAGLRASVERATGTRVPEGAWLLVDGGSPRASRWALVLLVLFAAFATWNVVGMVRIVAPVRDDARSRGPLRLRDDQATGVSGGEG